MVKKTINREATVPSSINSNYKMHVLVKYECLECERNFILSQKQVDDFREDITCPYCKAYNVESISWLEDMTMLEGLGCIGIGHVEKQKEV